MSWGSKNYASGDFGHVGDRRLRRVDWVLVGAAFLTVLVLGLWATTQWFAHSFGYSRALGEPITGTGFLHPPWRVITWLWALRGQDFAEVGSALEGLGMAFATAMVAAFFIFSSIARRLYNRADELHDSGRRACREDLEAHGMLSATRPSDGLVFGKFKNNLSASDKREFGEWAWENGDTGVLVIGPPGAGKNAGFLFPSLTTWRHNALIIDPKLENYKFTSGFRRKHLGQYCDVLDFTNGARSIRYNFLDWIRVGTDNETKDALNLAMYLCDETGKGVDDPRVSHWVVMPANLLAAAMLHVVYRAKREGWKERPTMYDVAWEMSGRDHPAVERAINNLVLKREKMGKPLVGDPMDHIDPTMEVIKSWRSYEHAEPGKGWKTRTGRMSTHPFVALRAQQQVDLMRVPEGTSHIGGVRKVLALFEDPHVRRTTAASDFKVEDLQDTKPFKGPDGKKYTGGLSLYFFVPQSDFKRYRPLIRAFICQATSRLTEEKDDDRRRLAYFLDELPVLGRIDPLFNLCAVGRGYGVKVILMVQSLGQLDNEWGRDASRVLTEQMEFTLAMTPSPAATTTAAKLSEMSSRATVQVRNLSQSMRAGTAAGANRSESEREVVRPVLTKGEIMQLPMTINLKDKHGKVVKRKDGTVVLKQAGQHLLFRKNLPIATLVQAPHYADLTYLRRTLISPPRVLERKFDPDYAEFEDADRPEVLDGEEAPAVESDEQQPSDEDLSASFSEGEGADEPQWDEVADFEDAGSFEDEDTDD